MGYAQSMLRLPHSAASCVILLLVGGLASPAFAQKPIDDVLPKGRFVPQVNPRGIMRIQVREATLSDFVEIKSILSAAIPPSVHALVARLDDPSYELREEATAELRANLSPDEVLLAVLEKESLTAEQRHRLLKVLQWRIQDRPRGAVGIRMSAGREGVLITELIPDLPAEKVLKVGDQILQIDGAVVRENQELVQVVQRMVPGTVIRMKVLRPRPNGGESEEVDVEFSLGSYKKLGNDPNILGVTNPETDRRRRFMLAIEKRYRAQPEVVSTPLGTEAGVIKGQ